MLPVDHVVVSEIAAGAANEVVETIPDGKIGVDIGPKTIEQYADVIAGAKTVIWNGPMGIFEKPPFDTGTVALAKAVADSGATSVVGGGDSEKAIKAAGVRPDLARFHRRRRVAGVSRRHRTPRRRRSRINSGGTLPAPSVARDPRPRLAAGPEKGLASRGMFLSPMPVPIPSPRWT